MVLVSCFGLRFVIDCYDFLVLCLVIGWGLFPERWDSPTLTNTDELHNEGISLLSFLFPNWGITSHFLSSNSATLLQQ